MNGQRCFKPLIISSSEIFFRRRAFTLVELLMVIVVIGILTSLLVVASMSVIGSARESATKGTIIKVNGMLKERLSVFSGHKTDPVQIASVSTIAAGDNKRAEVLARKVEFLRAFPQTWGEAVRANLIKETEVPATITPDAESSEVLYYVMTSSNSLGMSPVDTDAFNSNEVRDTNGNEKLEFVDAWGRPLRFYRWPTQLVRGGGFTDATEGSIVESDIIRAKILFGDAIKSVAQAQQDPDDPIALLRSGGWDSNANADAFEGNTTSLLPINDASGNLVGNFFHSLGTFHAPLLVSAGADGALGLYSPSSEFGSTNWTNRGDLARPESLTDNAPLYDNITNYNFRSGGN
jgi:prepilin-type N-terminal cleavage/methylation domain-containing protein